METTAGFYKLEDDNWLYAPNFVDAPDYTLDRDLRNTYVYPIDGWTWYDKQPYEEIITNIQTDNDNI